VVAKVEEHAVLVPTSQGPAGGIVCEPAGPSRAAVLFLHTAGQSGRSGFNSQWALLSRRLSALGTTVLRLDLGTEGDSLAIGEELYPIDSSEQAKVDIDRVLVQDCAAWFHDRMEGQDMIVVGSCYGTRLGLELAASDHDVAATLFVVPYIRVPDEGNRMRWQERMLKVRRAQPTDDLDLADGDPLDCIDPTVIDDFESALRSGPSWVLIGERDPGEMLALEWALGDPGLEVEVEPNVALYPGNDPDIQELVRDRVVARVRRLFDSAE
jgi:dienelactone hydrolase